MSIVSGVLFFWQIAISGCWRFLFYFEKLQNSVFIRCVDFGSRIETLGESFYRVG